MRRAGASLARGPVCACRAWRAARELLAQRLIRPDATTKPRDATMRRDLRPHGLNNDE